jgi:DNA-binding response OmpR family regulator
LSSRVLIIDDERGIAKALTIRLEASGYEVRWACDGTAGLAAAAEWKPDVILLDIRMPDIDGFEVNRRLRARPHFATPVIFLSANVQESARQAALAGGAHAFLTKPYESKAVLLAVQSALEQRVTTANAANQESPHARE